MDVQRTAELIRRLRERAARHLARADVLAALETWAATGPPTRYATGSPPGRPLPRSSVYNVLTSLAEAGLALTADAGPGPVLCEAGREWHHHFVCRSCRQLFDVECLAWARPCLTPGHWRRGGGRGQG